MGTRLEAPKAIPSTPEAQREALRDSVTLEFAQRGMDAWQRFPLEKRDEGVRSTYEGVLQKLITHQQESIPIVDAAYATLSPIVEGISPEAETRLSTICENLKAEPPTEYGEDPHAVEHPWLSRSEIAPLKKSPDGTVDASMMLSTYAIDDAAIRSDIDFLKSIQKPFAPDSPESNAIDSLIARLDAYRFIDPKNAIAEMMHRLPGGRGNTYMDKAGKEMGRIALGGFLVAGTVIFGAIALVQFIRKGEISFAPFLWGIAAWLMIDPDLLKTMFGKNNAILKDFEDINRATSSPALNDVVGRYKIGGPAWAAVVERIYEGEHGRILEVSDPDDETIDETVAALAGDDAAVRETLRAMITTKDAQGKSDFMKFVKGLEGVDGPEAREFMGTYVRNDAFIKGVPRDPAIGQNLRAAAKARRSVLGNS